MENLKSPHNVLTKRNIHRFLANPLGEYDSSVGRKVEITNQTGRENLFDKKIIQFSSLKTQRIEVNLA